MSASLDSSSLSTVLPALLQPHLEQLTASAISPAIITERGYRSITSHAELARLGFSSAQQHTPGILIPLWGVDGKRIGYQYRPDNPRTSRQGKPIKYENPLGSSIRLDCPPRCLKSLGDPQVPLWITEGSKKADALASQGACALSLTGVWGFKGKNELGGVVFLSDWDYIALEKRTVYLAFDSDIITKPPVRQALERLAEHIRRKGARLQVINLHQEGTAKVGIDDYLRHHSLDEAIKLATAFSPAAIAEEKEHSVPGFVLGNGIIGEMVVAPDGERSFIIAEGNSLKQAPDYRLPNVTYTPTPDPLVGKVIHFAPAAQPYTSQISLFNEIKAFIHHYLELPQNYEDVSTLYVLLTWVYEFAPSIPYLRVIGDWGSGKTRFLQVVGAICFRPMFASGATTPSPIFRILDRFRGTLVLDEADFKDSSAWVEIVKILNNGYRPGFPVLRADKDDGKWYPHAFDVFGPKLIATRAPFKDEALESRCLTAEMMSLTRQDIPRVLPPSFATEVDHLRSRLLTFRLSNLNKLKGSSFGNEFLEPDLQPRLQEILIPLKAMVNDDSSMAEILRSFIHQQQDVLFSRRRESPAGRVLAAIIELHAEETALTADNIAQRVTELDDEIDINARKVGWLTRKLGFKKERSPGSGHRAACWDEQRVARLAATYGIGFHPSISPEKNVKTSEMSQPASNSPDIVPDVFPTDPETSPETSQNDPISDPDVFDNSDVFSGDIKEDSPHV